MHLNPKSTSGSKFEVIRINRIESINQSEYNYHVVVVSDLSSQIERSEFGVRKAQYLNMFSLGDVPFSPSGKRNLRSGIPSPSTLHHDGKH